MGVPARFTPSRSASSAFLPIALLASAISSRTSLYSRPTEPVAASRRDVSSVVPPTAVCNAFASRAASAVRVRDGDQRGGARRERPAAMPPPPASRPAASPSGPGSIPAASARPSMPLLDASVDLGVEVDLVGQTVQALEIGFGFAGVGRDVDPQLFLSHVPTSRTCRRTRRGRRGGRRGRRASTCPSLSSRDGGRDPTPTGSRCGSLVGDRRGGARRRARGGRCRT